MLDFVSACAGARRGLPALRRGEYRTLAAEGPAVAYARELGGEEAGLAVVVLNAGRDAARLSLSDHALAGHDLAPLPLPGMASAEVRASEGGGGPPEVALAGRSGALLLPRSQLAEARSTMEAANLRG